MSTIPILNPTEILPDRYGWFYKEKGLVKGSSTVYKKELKDIYVSNLQNYWGLYKEHLSPFGISPISYDKNMATFIVVDIDKHKGDENIDIETLMSKFKNIKSFLENLKFNLFSEKSPSETGGIKIWIPLSHPIPLEKAKSFCKFLEKKFEVEVYPNKHQFIRLPGLYKDQNAGYSVCLNTNVTLNTFELIKERFEGNANDASFVLDICERYHTNTNTSAKKEPKKFVTEHDPKCLSVANQFDKYFEDIFKFVCYGKATKIIEFEIDKPFCCPFHDDNSPSAKISCHPLYGETKKTFMCFSHNCEMNKYRNGNPLDAFSLLWYFRYGEEEMSQKS